MIYTKNDDKHGINLFIKKNELKEKLSINNDNEAIAITVFIRIYKKRKTCILNFI